MIYVIHNYENGIHKMALDHIYVSLDDINPTNP